MAAHHDHPHAHPHPKGKHHHHWHVRHPEAPSPRAHHHPMHRGRPKPPRPSTARVRAVWRFVHRWFPQAASLGVYNCRKIAGSSRWSQHAWGDAWDMTTPGAVKKGTPTPALRAMVKAVRDHAGQLHVTRVIFGDDAHQNHAHVDVDPERTGTPPCAS